MNFAIKLKHKPFFYIDCFLLYIYFFLTLYIYFFRYESIYTYIRFAFLVIAALRGYYISIQKRFSFPFFLAALFTISYVLCITYQKSVNLSLTQFLYTLCYIGIAILLFEECYGLIGSMILLLVCSGVILFRYLQGVNPNTLLTYTSRNFISVLMLFVLILYYLAVYNFGTEGYISILIPALVYFMICSIAYGRGGILTSGYILCAFGFYLSFKTNNKYVRRGLRIFIFVVIAIIVIFLLFGGQLNGLFGKFNEHITDVNRLTYWETFLKNNTKSLTDFIFGSDAGLLRLDKNLHNSFLQCYASFGLIAFIIIIILCIRSLVIGIKNKNYFIVILMSALLLRSFTDRLFYNGYCEFFLYYFIMYWDYKLKYDTRVQNSDYK